MSASLTDFTAALPKAELHVHIEGTLEPELMFALAKRNQIDIPFKSVDEVRTAYRFTQLQDFLDIYYEGAKVLQREEDFRDLAMAYFDRAAADTVRHAEIFFDPQTHTARGIPFDVVMKGFLSAMEEAERTHGLTTKLILCFLRHLDEDDAFKTLRMSAPWQDRIVGVGLDSSEMGHPPRKFAKVFAAATEMGFKRVAHAGEEGPPEYVREALDILKVHRLDHGNRTLEDADLTARLAREAMTLTVCPLSNLKLCVVKTREDHPLPLMLAQGLRATINSDDPAYFGGYINDNYAALAGRLDRDDFAAIARNSFLGSFLTDAEVSAHLKVLDAYLER